MTHLEHRTAEPPAIGVPTISSAEYPNKRFAPSFQLVKMLFRFLLTGRITFGNRVSIVLKSAGRPNVYTIDPPSNPVLLNRNLPRGPQRPTYVVLINQLSLNAFDGPNTPTDASNLEPGLCANHNYKR